MMRLRSRRPPAAPPLLRCGWCCGHASPTDPCEALRPPPDTHPLAARATQAKLTAAGAAAPEKIVFRGAEVTATLAACGLEEDASIEATVCKAA